MPSDFAKVGKTLESAISVPDLPIESIRRGARAARVRHQWRVLVACVLAAIVALGSGTVLAAKAFQFRIWLYGNRAAGTPLRSFTIYLGPDETTLRHVISSATFPVVLPMALPSGARVLRLVTAPADHPSVILIMYHTYGSRDLGYTLIDSSLVQNGAPPPLPDVVSAPIARMHFWRVGSEMVLSQDPLQWPQDDTIKAAMLRATPAASLAHTISRLYRITSLGGFLGVANIADAIAPADGRSALIDRGHLDELPALVRSEKPLFVMQSTMVDDIPTIRGRQDLGHASFHPGPKKLAVSARGLRAVAAVLKTNACGNAPTFTCEMLINERSGMPYRVWVLPIRSPKAAKKYVVDAQNYHVEPAQ
jgi:hypothetical protein